MTNFFATDPEGNQLYDIDVPAVTIDTLANVCHALSQHLKSSVNFIDYRFDERGDYLEFEAGAQTLHIFKRAA